MNSYHEARSAALKELADAAKQKETFEKRIARLKQTVASLDALIEGDETSAQSKQEMQVVGITDAVRNALKIANSPRTAVDVRDWLANSGYDLSDQENALASIHTILKRLVKSGEAKDGLNEEGKAVYKWEGTPQAGSGFYAHQLAQVAANIRQQMLDLNSSEFRNAAAAAMIQATNEARQRIREASVLVADPPYSKPQKQLPPKKTNPAKRGGAKKRTAPIKPIVMNDETGIKKVIK